MVIPLLSEDFLLIKNRIDDRESDADIRDYFDMTQQQLDMIREADTWEAYIEALNGQHKKPDQDIVEIIDELIETLKKTRETLEESAEKFFKII